MQDQTTPIPVQITASSTEPLDKTNILAITGNNTQTPNRLIVTNKSYAAVALGYPDLQVGCLAVWVMFQILYFCGAPLVPTNTFLLHYFFLSE